MNLQSGHRIASQSLWSGIEPPKMPCNPRNYISGDSKLNLKSAARSCFKRSAVQSRAVSPRPCAYGKGHSTSGVAVVVTIVRENNVKYLPREPPSSLAIETNSNRPETQ